MRKKSLALSLTLLVWVTAAYNDVAQKSNELIAFANSITIKPGAIVNRANYGVYAATCVICHEEYVGHNTFSMRWSSHRTDRNKPDCKIDNAQMALSRYYSVTMA